MVALPTRSPARKTPAIAPRALRPGTVAVAPFVNISAQSSDDWIGAGIAETVAADLERLDAVSVIGREAFAARADGAAMPSTADVGTAEDVARQVSRQLGAAWLVTGGYQRLGDQLRITARIIDTETGAVSATAKVDGAVDDIFALQDRILAELAAGFAPGGDASGMPVAPRGPPTEASGATAGDGVNGNGGGASRGGADVGRLSGLPSSNPGRRGQNGGSMPPPAARPEGSPAALAPEDVTGGIAIDKLSGDSQPRVGLAAAAGILTGRPIVRPPRTQDRPNIDGRLDDAVWRNAVQVTDFVQQQPLEGAPATEETDVFIAYDSQNIYFAFHAHYSDPSIMRANRVDRDQAFRDDKISVYFDPFLDQQRAYSFSVNGYGVQGDALMNARGGGGGGRGRGRSGGGRGGRGGGGGGPGSSRRGIPFGDNSWDALFDSGAEIVDDGFTAEMAIPFKSLRYPQRGSGTPHRWGFQIVREIRGKDENVVWAPISRGVSGFLTQMGLLDGMTNLSTSRNLEFLPTFTGIRFGSIDSSTGDFVSGDPQPEGGVNVKYGITSNLTADLTFNPDFSQIESDRPQIEVNQRFALFFPELRPFFLEGAEIFQSSGPVTLVHTRTIVDPDWGSKVTGKIGNTTVGVMMANDAAAGSLEEETDPAFGQSANIFVGRARYDLYSESYVGALFTDREFLDSYSRVGGIDGNFRLGRTQSFGFRALQTEHRDLDAIESSGQMFDVNWRLNGRHWNGFVRAYTLSPEFKTDVGFVRRVDQKRIFSNLGYRFWPESWVINWGPRFTYGRNWNFDDILEDEEFRVGVNATFARNISVNFDVRQEMERFGGINFDKTGYSFFGSVNTSRKLSVGGFFRYGDEIRYTETPFSAAAATAASS